jgi:lysozyme
VIETPITTGIVDIHHDDRGYDLAAAARGGLVALIHKATEGCTFRDERFYGAMNAAEDAGLLRGAYHFARGTSDPVDQAEVFVARVRGLARHDDILLALDLEGSLDDPRTPENEAPTTMTTENAARFVEHVRTLTGRWPLLYAGLSKLRTRMKRTDDATRATLGRCPLWLAAYGPNPLKLAPPAPWASWSLQQYTNGSAGPHDTARFPRTIAGFERPAQDHSVFRGTLEELRAWWGSAGRS